MLVTRGHRCYYYRCKRSGAAVQRVYVGSGDKARAAAAEDARRRERQQADLAAWSARRSDLDAADALVDELDRLTSAMIHYFLLSGGYHRHARSTWRRRRGDG